MRIALVVATDLDGVIGRDNRLPWHLPADLQHFKRVTMGKPMIMGRRTWESIGGALPGRTSIVLTRTPHFAASGGRVAQSVAAALELAAEAVAASPEPEVAVIGGVAIFEAFLPRAARIYWTQVQAHVQGDVRLPAFDLRAWKETERVDRPADDTNAYALSFRVLDRRETPVP